MLFKKTMLACLALSFTFYSCETDQSEVFKDVISYNYYVLNQHVTNCTIIDKDASCAHKTESYIIECEGSDSWFKWETSSRSKYGVAVFTIPKNFSNYQCNPQLNYKKQFKGHDKCDTGWVAMEYSENGTF